MRINFISSISILAFFLLAMTSCGNAIDFIEESELTQINGKIGEYLKAEDKAEDITLFGSTSTTVGFDIQSMQVNYLNENGDRRKVYIPISGSGSAKDEVTNINPVEIPPKKGQKLSSKGRSINDYNFSIISTNVNKAIDIAKVSGYEVEGVSSYSITFYEDSLQDRHSFLLLSKVDNSTRLQGRHIVTEYKELSCSVGDNGDIKIEGLNKED